MPTYKTYPQAHHLIGDLFQTPTFFRLFGCNIEQKTGYSGHRVVGLYTLNTMAIDSKEEKTQNLGLSY